MTNPNHALIAAAFGGAGISALLFITYDVNWQVFSLALIAAMSVWSIAVDKRDCASGFIILVVWAIAISTELISFSFFDQARSLMEKNVDPVELLLAVDLWGPRFLISYPAIWIAERWRLDLDSAFTIYGGLLMSAQTLVLANLVVHVMGTKRAHPTRVLCTAFFLVFLLGLAATMNGRLAAAHLGIAVILLSQVRAIDHGSVTFTTWWQHAIGMFLTMMTSGTAMVGFLQVACAPIILSNRSHGRPTRRAAVILPVATVLLVALPIIQAGIEKNLEYWGGGFESMANMLEHGWGEFLASSGVIVGVGVAVVGGSYTIIALKHGRNYPKLVPLLINIPTAVVCGIYGYSTLTMVLPALASAVLITALQTTVPPSRRAVPLTNPLAARG